MSLHPVLADDIRVRAHVLRALYCSEQHRVAKGGGLLGRHKVVVARPRSTFMYIHTYIHTYTHTYIHTYILSANKIELHDAAFSAMSNTELPMEVFD